MTEVPAPVLSGDSEFYRVEQKVEGLRVPLEKLKETYAIRDLIPHLLSQKYSTIALQFPDDLIPESVPIFKLLQEELNAKSKDDESYNPQVYILADTSYSPCCVDEIAAKHINADVVVHFGNACLNPVQNLPVVYIFGGSFDIDRTRVVEKFREAYADKSQHILLLSDPQYSDILSNLYSTIESEYPNTIVTHVELPKDDDKAAVIPKIVDVNPDGKERISNILPNRWHEPLKAELHDYEIFYLTSSNPSPSLILHLTTLVSNVQLLQMDADLRLTVPRTALMKRYRYMNMARSASTIGILINTLSLRNVNEVLNKVKDWITAAGKKYYTFVVGKPNVPKLANFDVIDIWVVLGCPLGGIIVDSDEFYKPIITPYELSLALQREITWTGKWLIDFEAVLNEYGEETKGDAGSDSEFDEDAPEFDPVTGKYVSTSRPLRRLKHVNVEEDESGPTNGTQDGSTTALTHRLAGTLTIRNTVSTAAEHLYNKLTWSGLGSEFPEESDEEGAEVEEGRAGIARGYAVGESDRT
ncbi:2-(3-amino-3-carboxypropyl)histidine synthase subunit 2 [Trichomonascus vanleenenianus]|uniref:2-(3-amino-3-carboxypropyl)histidine synthase n=1 Tax=Trichomonascus vanleenenianus TaxID=2268995 RepID=UPI003ECA94EE